LVAQEAAADHGQFPWRWLVLLRGNVHLDVDESLVRRIRPDIGCPCCRLARAHARHCRGGNGPKAQVLTFSSLDRGVRGCRNDCRCNSEKHCWKKDSVL